MYEDRIAHRVNEHVAAIERLRSQLPLVETIALVMIGCLKRNGRIYWAGNGGSAADSQHFAAELVGRFEKNRRGLPSISLAANTPTLTAVGNDYGFDRVFARQVEALCTAHDCLVAISTSGNSTNIVEAIRSARAVGTTTIGLTGYEGGQIRALADHCLIVPAHNTAIIQEAHALICHILCDLIEENFFGNQQ